MSEVTRILAQIESGDPAAAEKLLPLVYDELRQMAAAQMARENPGQTLQATALVHEAYLRLAGATGAASFANRRHFFRVIRALSAYLSTPNPPQPAVLRICASDIPCFIRLVSHPEDRESP